MFMEFAALHPCVTVEIAAVVVKVITGVTAALMVRLAKGMAMDTAVTEVVTGPIMGVFKQTSV